MKKKTGEDKTDELVVSAKHKVYAKIIGQDEQFRLMSVTEAYELIKQGKEVMFLNAKGKEVKVSSIEKINNYDGKIYDVDVPNDVVLVRRGGENATAFWSGIRIMEQLLTRRLIVAGSLAGRFLLIKRMLIIYRCP